MRKLGSGPPGRGWDGEVCSSLKASEDASQVQAGGGESLLKVGVGAMQKWQEIQVGAISKGPREVGETCTL